MARMIFAACALVASASLVEAGDHATFSPNLRDPVAAGPVETSPIPAASVAEAAPSGRGRTTKRKTRIARTRAPRVPVMAALRPGLDDSRPLTIAANPAPLPPVHEDGKVADAVATLQAPAGRSGVPNGGNIEAAAPTPHSAALSHGGGPREAPSETVSELLARHARDNGVPLKLAQAVVQIESRGNAHAVNHGALGLMQIKYGTARAVGFAGPAMGLFVADTNLRFGMKVLGQAYKAAGGDTCGALMRYQSGHYATHMSAANRAYCLRARAIMAGA